MKLDIVDFAHQILKMQDKIDRLEAENAHLNWFKKEYYDLLESTNNHNEVMLLNTLDLFLTPGVIEACQKNKPFKSRIKKPN